MIVKLYNLDYDMSIIKVRTSGGFEPHQHLAITTRAQTIQTRWSQGKHSKSYYNLVLNSEEAVGFEPTGQALNPTSGFQDRCDNPSPATLP